MAASCAARALRGPSAPPRRVPGLAPGAGRERDCGAFARGLLDAGRANTPSGAVVTPAASPAALVTWTAFVPQRAAPGFNRKLSAHP